MSTKTTRGIKNNNPGNIRQSDTDWLGESAIDNDLEFEEFDTPEQGIRAMAIVLKNYYFRHGLKTIREFITRWAPPTENDTEAYITAVSKEVGLEPDQPFYIVQYMEPMVKAIIRHENGKQPYSDEIVSSGIAMALA